MLWSPFSLMVLQISLLLILFNSLLFVVSKQKYHNKALLKWKYFQIKLSWALLKSPVWLWSICYIFTSLFCAVNRVENVLVRFIKVYVVHHKIIVLLFVKSNTFTSNTEVPAATDYSLFLMTVIVMAHILQRCGRLQQLIN